MRNALIATAAIALLLAGEASAADTDGLPDPKDPAIEVPSSLGGIEIGDNLQDANRAWGSRDICSRGVCSYGNFASREGAARIVREDGGVSIVQIHAGSGDKPTDDVFKGPLLQFRTTVGNIGLGSKLSDVRKAFPDAEPTPGVGRGFQVEGKGTQVMTFQGWTSRKRVVEIVLRAKPE